MVPVMLLRKNKPPDRSYLSTRRHTDLPSCRRVVTESETPDLCCQEGKEVSSGHEKRDLCFFLGRLTRHEVGTRDKFDQPAANPCNRELMRFKKE
jgi:hypothetical protein